MAEYMKLLMGASLPVPELLDKKTIALMIIDMQYLSSNWETGVIKNLRDQGNEQELQYFKSRVKIITSNIQKLQKKFREKRMEVIFIRSGTITMDGRERSIPDKDRGIACPPGSRLGEILDDIKPVNDEIVVSKTSSSPFNSSNVDYILRNLGIEYLIITGMQTSMCVETTIRDAAEKGYSTILVEDACLNRGPRPHEIALKRLNGIYTTVKKTDEILKIIDVL